MFSLSNLAPAFYTDIRIVFLAVSKNFLSSNCN